jgi:hypothetical protein
LLRPGPPLGLGGVSQALTGCTSAGSPPSAQHVDCDVYRIEAADPYPDGYDGTVAGNVTEQDADARPEIADPRASIDGYEHVLLGSPIWNVRPR